MKNSITKRWLFSTMIITLVFFSLLLILGVASVRSYYYSGVRNILESKAMTVISSIEKEKKGSSAAALEKGISKEVQRFSDRDIIDITAISNTGKIKSEISSSGFNVDSDVIVPEYNFVRENDRYFNENAISDVGERYISYTVRVPHGSSIYALRFSTSIEKINTQIIIIIIGLLLFGIIVMFAVIYSGAYFIRSIAIPVGQVSSTARKIAMGDFSQRLDIRNQDEIGELCESVNYMAESLAKSEKMKNDFISSVSHELRTPLTAIKGWSETLKEIDDKGMTKKGLEIISKETNRLSDMLEELLDFSSVQKGQFTLIRNEMNIEDVLDETVVMFKEKASKEGINLVYTVLDETPYIYGDKNRLKQVFINLIDNAIKYTPENGEVAIQVYYLDDFVVVTISDTGSGIAKDDLNHVKTKFYKGAKARQGSGIGLAVVDEIISLHGGDFIIESKKFEGTKVTIKLPIE